MELLTLLVMTLLCLVFPATRMYGLIGLALFAIAYPFSSPRRVLSSLCNRIVTRPPQILFVSPSAAT